MKRIFLLLLAIVLCFLCACSANDTSIDTDAQEITVPNNGEWDEILCSGDSYHLVKKEVDAYDGYKFMLGIVNDAGEWVQELTDTGTFVENVRFRAEGSSEILRDNSCYIYLGEGVFLASPGVSVFSVTGNYRVGPWEDKAGKFYIDGWECLFWNAIDNLQFKCDATKITTYQDGYLLFCEREDIKGGGGELSTMNTSGEVNELSCQYLPNKPMHKFPVYAEGLFYASTEKSKPAFFDIEGTLVIDLSEYNMGRVPFTSVIGANAPYFENGKATIMFVNNANSVFKAVIDKTGAFVEEPEKMEGVSVI